jgi:hypothetical protein
MIVEHILPHVPGANVQYKKGGFDPRNYRVSFDKIAQTLGFRVRHSVKDSVSALVNALENHVFDDVEDRKNFYGNYSVLGG